MRVSLNRCIGAAAAAARACLCVYASTTKKGCSPKPGPSKSHRSNRPTHPTDPSTTTKRPKHPAPACTLRTHTEPHPLGLPRGSSPPLHALRRHVPQHRPRPAHRVAHLRHPRHARRDRALPARAGGWRNFLCVGEGGTGGGGGERVKDAWTQTNPTNRRTKEPSIHPKTNKQTRTKTCQDIFLACPVQYRARPFWVEGGEHNNLEAILR
jgi:hypothetical protein